MKAPELPTIDVKFDTSASYLQMQLQELSTKGGISISRVYPGNYGSRCIPHFEPR